MLPHSAIAQHRPKGVFCNTKCYTGSILCQILCHPRTKSNRICKDTCCHHCVSLTLARWRRLCDDCELSDYYPLQASVVSVLAGLKHSADVKQNGCCLQIIVSSLLIATDR